jgi:Domain of unknown function (DUF3883)
VIATRFLRMSVLNALLALQDHRRANQQDSLDQAATLLSGGLASRAAFDYDAALAVIELVPNCSDIIRASRMERLRALVEMIVRADASANWVKLLPLGRAHVATYLRDTNILQCFEAAGLFLDPIDTEGLRWWLRMQDFARALESSARTEIGMRGEQLTLRNEQAKLSAAGRADLQPKWRSLEDNTLGYDVESFEIEEGGVAKLFIEVKASDTSPLRFFVSRRQWQIATSMARRYRFHVWNLSSEALLTLTPHEMSAHIPLDQGHGLWQRVEVVIG